MKLIIKQKLFSIFDDFNVYDENGYIAYKVKGQFGLSHNLKIYSSDGNEVGKIVERLISVTPQFEIYERRKHVGSIKRKLISIGPAYDINFRGWKAKGNIFEWDYKIIDSKNNTIAKISKQLFRLTDTYTIDVSNPHDVLHVLMFVLAIDAEKCSRDR